MARKDVYKSIAEKPHSQTEDDKLRLSFKFIDWESEEFFIHGLTKQYYELLFSAFNDIQHSTADEIKQQKHPRLIPKYIKWKGDSTITREAFPADKIKSLLKVQSKNETELQEQFKEMTRDSFELSVAKNYGRIHGFIFANTFHVVWIDPAHNLFPGKDKGGKTRKTKLPSDIAHVKTFCPEEFTRIRDENIDLHEENLKLRQENDDLLI